MRSVIYAAFALPVLLLAMAFTSATKVTFVSSSWETAQNQAKSESKLFFVDFDASYCASCRNMDESTYQDSRLASFIKDNVVALRLDVQDFDGVMWSQKYEVEALPTMLIFNQEGKLVKRLVGFKSAGQLIQEFQAAKNSVNNTPEPAPRKAPQPIAEDKPIVRPSSRATTSGSGSYNPAPFGGFGSASAGGPSGKGLYEVDVRKLDGSKGYAVQVGVFSSQESLLDQASKVKKLFPDQPSMIHIDEMRGREVYKLLVGQFTVRSSANAFIRQVKNAGMNGLVKDLSEMK
jgi:thioredoxin 1